MSLIMSLFTAVLLLNIFNYGTKCVLFKLSMTVLFVFKRNKKIFCKCAKVRKEIHTLTETQNLFTVCVIAVFRVFDLFQC